MYPFNLLCNFSEIFETTQEVEYSDGSEEALMYTVEPIVDITNLSVRFNNILIAFNLIFLIKHCIFSNFQHIIRLSQSITLNSERFQLYLDGSGTLKKFF